MYTILDIETTGGKFREEKIIEIALYKYDGETIIDSFSTLVNPEKEIHFYVKKLTGITEKMVKRSPKFHEIAKRIVEICKDSIIIAHNAEFDYRMLKQEFKSLGYSFESETLDTIELSKILIPNEASYSLGKLCKSLGIILLDEHRAFGDAKATLELFKILIDKDKDKIIQKKEELNEYKNHKTQNIPEKLANLLEGLPIKTGVYYFYNAQNEIIYVGKSINIKNRVRQHFISKSTRAIKIQKFTENIQYEITGSELIALIKESIEIKALKPIFNRAQRKTIFVYDLYEAKNEFGYKSLYISKIKQDKKPIISFSSLEEAKSILHKITEKFALCQKINSLYKTDTQCFKYSIKECFGACMNEENPENYNKRVDEFLDSISHTHQQIIYQDKGKTEGEKSFIQIENGILKGYGYYTLYNQINTKEKINKRMVSIYENQDLKRIVRNYLLKYPKKIIEHSF